MRLIVWGFAVHDEFLPVSFERGPGMPGGFEVNLAGRDGFAKRVGCFFDLYCHAAVVNY